MDSVVVVCGLSCPVVCGILGSLTRDGTHVPCIGRQILNHWTTREVPKFCVNLILSSGIRFLKKITVDSQTAVIKYE